MTRFELKQFGNPDFLRRIRSETLRDLLAPHAAALARHRFSVPSGAFTDEHIESLAQLLVAVPDDLPAALLEALEMADTLTSNAGWLELQAAAPDQVSRLLEFGDGPGDVALRLWRQQPQIVERIFTKLRLHKRRALVCYRPRCQFELAAVTPAMCKTMEAELSREFSDLLSSAACEITAFAEPRGQAFLIRHGEPLKRIGVFDDCGRPQTKVIRPIKHDVAYICAATGELQISGMGAALQETYRSVFGKHLFGSAAVLQRSMCYTLEPIREGRNCLNCIEIPAIESVKLRALQLRRRSGTTRTTYEGDVFDELDRLGAGGFDDYELERARFQLRLRQQRRALVIELTPGRDTVAGDGAAPLAQEWMQHRGFICDHEHELEAVLESR